jgi:hypothetical protein
MLHTNLRLHEGEAVSEELIMKMRKDMQETMDSFRGQHPIQPVLSALEDAIRNCILEYVNMGVIQALPHVVILHGDDDKRLVDVILVDPKHPARFKHDCDECTYLGASDYFDHYFCQKTYDKFAIAIRPGSCIARFGDEGSEYESSPTVVAERSTKGVRISFEVANRIGLLRR